MKILFVCTGNICRSPSAEAILRKYCNDAGLKWTIDSAGTGGWHEGEAPDSRAQQAAEARGYDMRGITARSLCVNDYVQFDRIYAMTEEHYRFLRANAPAQCPADLILFMGIVKENTDVPDPYYGGDAGFERMIDMLEQGCGALIEQFS